MPIQIQYSHEIVKRGTTRHDRVEDGDTVFINEGIRMLGIDTPEIHFPGRSNPSNHDDALEALSRELAQRGVNAGLASHLRNRLRRKAGTRQLHQGDAATEALQSATDTRLARYSERTGNRIRDRDLYIHVASDVFDHYGRMLAYVAPSYTRRERREIPPSKRPTFNLQMLRLGWATTIFIYPNIPQREDLQLARRAVRRARRGKRGAWADARILLGYEFRSCVRLSRGEEGWITRYCIDMTNRRIYPPQDYYRVYPENRIFLWPKDLRQVMTEMNLIPQFDRVPADAFVSRTIKRSRIKG